MLTDTSRATGIRSLRVLVTGAAGFVGANLARRLLDDGARVSVLVRTSSDTWRLDEILPQLRVCIGDLEEPGSLRDALAAATPDVVFHLATGRGPASAEGRLQILRSNVVGTWNLLEAAAGSGRPRVVCAGSSMEYGPGPDPHREDDPLRPATFFATTKAMASELCSYAARALALPVVQLRVFSVYGPWEGPGRLLPKATLAAMSGARLPLTGPGFRRDFVHVDDVVRAMLMAAVTVESGGETINIGTGVETSNEDVVALIGQIIGRPVAVDAGAYAPHASDTAHWVADISKAKRALGWEPAYDLRSGLEAAVEWWRLHAELYAARLQEGKP